MKRNLLIAFFALLLTGAGIFGFFYLSPAQPNHTAVTVNGTPITETQIQERMKYHIVRNQAFATVFQNVPDAEEQLKAALGPTDREGALQELIKGQVIRDALKEYKDPYTYQQTTEAADSEWELMKTDSSQASFYLALSNALSDQGVSEQDYITYNRDFAYDFYNTSRLEQAYAQQEQPLSDSSAPEQQFSVYVDDLMARAEVVYP